MLVSDFLLFFFIKLHLIQFSLIIQHLECSQWTLIEIFGDKPPARLDFAYCKATFQFDNNKNDNDENKTNEKGNFFIIHGGMDTEGNVFDDCYIMNIQ
jgi:hypothetical protein